MCCRIVEMNHKEVICIKDGARLGCVDDVEIDTGSGRLQAIVIYGRPHFFGLFGRDEDIIINWECIEVIGEDTILVSFEVPHGIRRHRFPFFTRKL